MEFRLQDLIDIALIQEFQDKLSKLYAIPTGILDNETNILTHSAWQDICINFHRANPESETECRVSDQYIINRIHEKDPIVSYRCFHGLTDSAVPIYIDGKHMGSFFAGQIFLETPDIEHFRRQAREYGYDEEAYLQALAKVPVYSKEEFNHFMELIEKFTQIIAWKGTQRIIEIREEKIVEENEAKFRTIFENSVDAISVSVGGTIIFVNQAYSKLFGYDSNDEFFGKKIITHIAESERERVGDYIRKRYKGDEVPVSYETTGLRKDGTEFFFDVHVTSVKLSGINYTIATLRDISEIKYVEQKLNRSNNVLANIMDSIPQSVFWKDTDGVYLGCNKVFAQNAGLENPEEIVGLTDYDLPWPRTETESYRSDDRYVIRNNQPKSHIIEPLRKADGTQILIDTTKVPLTDSSGNIYGVLGVFDDVTVKTKINEELKIEKARAELYLRIAGVMLVAIDPEANLTMINKKGCDVLGYKESELIGRNWFKTCLPEEEYEFVFSSFKLMISGDLEPFEYFENSIIRKDRTKRSIAWHNTLLYDKNLKITGTLSSGEDITERNLALEALKESEEKFRTLYEQMAQGVVYHDCEGKIISINKSACDILGITMEYIIGKSPVDGDVVHESIPGAGYGGSSHPVFTSLKTGETVSNVIMGLKNKVNNRHIWLLVNTTPMFHEGEDKPYQVFSTFTDITEQKTINEALEKEKKLNDAIFNSIPGILYLYDDQGNLVKWNKKHELLTGYSAEELETKKLMDWYAGDEVSQAAVMEGVRVTMEQGFGEAEARLQRKDGSTVPMHLTATPLEIDGKLFFTGIGLDISDQKMAEAAIAESWGKYFSLFNQMLDAFAVHKIVYDENGKPIDYIFRDINPAFEILTGWKSDEIISKSLLEVLPVFEVNTLELLEKVVLTGIPAQFESFSAMLSRHYEIKAYKPFGDQLAVIFSDVTEKKIAAEKLRESESKLKTITQNAPVLIFQLDREGRIEYINKTSHNREIIDAIGKNIYDTIPENFHELLRNKLQTVFETGETLEYESTGPDYQNNIRTSIIRVSPIIENDKVVSAIFISSDITEKKQADEEIKKLNLELEKKVLERTEELNIAMSKLENSNVELRSLNDAIAKESIELVKLNDKLALSEQELKNANETKDKFFSIIAHDMKNPLQGLVLTSDLLAMNIDTFDNAKIKKKASQFNKTTRELTYLLENLLTWARSQGGRIAYQPEPIYLKSLVENVVELFSELIQQKAINIMVCDSCNHAVYADKNLIHTVLRNLVSNAVKFTGNEGTVEICAEESGDFIRLSVKDSGIGIATKDIEKLFRIDVPNESIGKSKEKGTGLGLIICREFVEKCGGNIWVESKYNSGTTFFFTLPKALPEDSL